MKDINNLNNEQKDLDKRANTYEIIATISLLGAFISPVLSSIPTPTSVVTASFISTCCSGVYVFSRVKNTIIKQRIQKENLENENTSEEKEGLRTKKSLKKTLQTQVYNIQKKIDKVERERTKKIINMWAAPAVATVVPIVLTLLNMPIPSFLTNSFVALAICTMIVKLYEGTMLTDTIIELNSQVKKTRELLDDDLDEKENKSTSKDVAKKENVKKDLSLANNHRKTQLSEQNDMNPITGNTNISFEPEVESMSTQELKEFKSVLNNRLDLFVSSDNITIPDDKKSVNVKVKMKKKLYK